MATSAARLRRAAAEKVATSAARLRRAAAEKVATSAPRRPGGGPTGQPRGRGAGLRVRQPSGQPPRGGVAPRTPAPRWPPLWLRRCSGTTPRPRDCPSVSAPRSAGGSKGGAEWQTPPPCPAPPHRMGGSRRPAPRGPGGGPAGQPHGPGGGPTLAAAIGGATAWGCRSAGTRPAVAPPLASPRLRLRPPSA